MECVGISIIWSSYWGYTSYWLYILLHTQTNNKSNTDSNLNPKHSDGKLLYTLYKNEHIMYIKLLYILSMIYCIALWIYYAISDSDPLTTIAHICAIVLGICISKYVLCYYKLNIDTTTNTPTDTIPADSTSNNNNNNNYNYSINNSNNDIDNSNDNDHTKSLLDSQM